MKNVNNIKMNKTLLERQPNNKRIATTESLQKRFFNGSKNLVIEIEKLMVHQSAAKKRIIFGLTIFLEILFAERQKKVKRRTVQRVLSQGFFICLYVTLLK